MRYRVPARLSNRIRPPMTRPDVLQPLFAPIERVEGVGPRVAKLLEKLGITRVIDALWHMPTGAIDRRKRPKIAHAVIGAVATIELTVVEHRPPPNRRRPYVVVGQDDTGFLSLVFFRARGDYLERVLPVGEQRVVSGKVEAFNDRLQMAHPDFIARPDEMDELAVLEPVYPMTEGLSPKTLAKAVGEAVRRAPELPEWNDTGLMRQRGWPGWRDALATVHRPQDTEDLSPTGPARTRLAYDELLASQLALSIIRARERSRAGRVYKVGGPMREKLLGALPFPLTGAQLRVLGEIDNDMAAPRRMLRLLQGDVGSGKTVVAMCAMLNALESGAQAALMAPTELLARQHLETLTPWAEALGVPLLLLTGRDRGKARDAALADLAAGRIGIAIGTHALFQEGVDFADLGLVVVDEQHRFGVHQRMLLSQKGRHADVLVMTATPIPRTLAMAAYGDLDQSILDEKPPGRIPVDTRAMPLDRLEDVIGGVARAMDKGAKVYWVCPAVEESEEIDLVAATDRYDSLKKRFGDKVALVHGRMAGPDKDRVMARFSGRDNDLLTAADTPVDLLVATTVIEVGVNVPEATVMVVEQAERFGLAQLHQLRGRVGRGLAGGTCLLLYSAGIGESARARLRILRETDDGFRIAEEDLRIRGSGEVLGTRQSGLPQFRVADLDEHRDLLAVAHDDSRLVMERDPELTGPRGQALRVLLYLFERDAAVRYLLSG